MLQKSFQLFETPCSSMDRTGASQALDTGSIPVGGTLEHFSAACPVSLLRVRYSGSLRGRLHRCTMETCSARLDPHTLFPLAPSPISLHTALTPRRLTLRSLPHPGNLKSSWQRVPSNISTYSVVIDSESILSIKIWPLSITMVMKRPS